MGIQVGGPCMGKVAWGNGLKLPIDPSSVVH